MSLIFDTFQARAQCFVAFLAAVTVFERRLTRQAGLPFEPMSYEDILAKAHAQPTPFRDREERNYKFLDVYLRAPHQRGSTAIDGKNKKHVTPVMCAFLARRLSDDFFREGSPLDLASQEQIGSPEDHEIANRLKRLTDATRLRSIMDKVQPEELGRNESVRRFLREIVGAAAGLVHPDFPRLPLFDLRALKVEFFGFEPDSADSPHWGLYAVVREPRGWAAKDPGQINIIVRDIFWLTPPKSGRDESFRGFYASVIDGSAFVIDRVPDEDGDIFTAYGRLQRKGRNTLRIRLVFAKPRDPVSIEMSHGVLAGTAGDGKAPTFAAWKALVINTDWDDLQKLEGLLFQLEAKDNQLAFDLLADVGAAGVLFSKRLLNISADNQHRRETFRNLIASDRNQVTPEADILGDFLSKDLKDQIGAAIERAGKQLPEETIDDIMNALGGYVKSRWHLIEPAQIIMFKTLGAAAARNEHDLHIMLDRKNIERATAAEED